MVTGIFQVSTTSIQKPLRLKRLRDAFVANPRATVTICGLIVYALLCIGAGIIIYYRSSNVTKVVLAARDLPFNHRITEADITVDPNVPRAYLRKVLDDQGIRGRFVANCGIKQGDSIDPSKTNDAPILRGVSSLARVHLPQQLVVADAVDAGSIVDICKGAKCLHNVRVVARQCKSTKDEEDCELLLDVDENIVPEVLDSTSKAMPVIVVRF
jgi:hypothetical protein